MFRSTSTSSLCPQPGVKSPPSSSQVSAGKPLVSGDLFVVHQSKCRCFCLLLFEKVRHQVPAMNWISKYKLRQWSLGHSSSLSTSMQSSSNCWILLPQTAGKVGSCGRICLAEFRLETWGGYDFQSIRLWEIRAIICSREGFQTFRFLLKTLHLYEELFWQEALVRSGWSVFVAFLMGILVRIVDKFPIS